jgi:glyoxylase-like metal-dependent hydrolase (beta-lactamase superfamily II)
VRNDQVEQDQLFERLWTGDAAMEEWTAAVPGGSAKRITDSVIAIHTGYLFGNSSAVRTDAGLVLVDTGSRETASQTFAALRRWDDSPVHRVIYTHGHTDHSWGAGLLDQEADAREIARPRIVAHRNVHNRFDRYDATHELNSLVMGRQFNQPGYTFPKEHRRPDQVYDDHLALMVGSVRIELFHGRGETDDATFVWLPEQRIFHASQPIFGGTGEVGYGALHRQVSSPGPVT